MSYLNEEIVVLNREVKDADEAIRQSGELLEKEELVTKEYIDAMVNSYHENGPYFVIAPGIAIAHARPEDGVNVSSVSLLQLNKPIEFGHEQNDPVSLVFGLAATSDESHLENIQRLVSLLGDKENVETLKHAKDYDDIKEIVGGE